MDPLPRESILAECTCVATWYLGWCELCNFVSYLVWVVPNCQQEMVGQPVGRIKFILSKSLLVVQYLYIKQEGGWEWTWPSDAPAGRAWVKPEVGWRSNPSFAKADSFINWGHLDKLGGKLDDLWTLCHFFRLEKQPILCKAVSYTNHHFHFQLLHFCCHSKHE